MVLGRKVHGGLSKGAGHIQTGFPHVPPGEVNVSFKIAKSVVRMPWTPFIVVPRAAKFE